MNKKMAEEFTLKVIGDTKLEPGSSLFNLGEIMFHAVAEAGDKEEECHFSVNDLQRVKASVLDVVRETQSSEAYALMSLINDEINDEFLMKESPLIAA